MLMMFSCAMLPDICASSRNRAFASASAQPCSVRIFTATGRPITVSRARYTCDIPPPRNFSSSYLPMRAGRSTLFGHLRHTLHSGKIATEENRDRSKIQIESGRVRFARITAEGQPQVPSQVVAGSCRLKLLGVTKQPEGRPKSLIGSGRHSLGGE